MIPTPGQGSSVALQTNNNKQNRKLQVTHFIMVESGDKMMGLLFPHRLPLCIYFLVTMSRPTDLEYLLVSMPAA